VCCRRRKYECDGLYIAVADYVSMTDEASIKLVEHIWEHTGEHIGEHIIIMCGCTNRGYTRKDKEF
jgi:hypothetical protein